MKAYVIVTLNLCAMHGANMYIYNKARFMKDQGWQVYVYSAEQGDILIRGLREYKKYQNTLLRFYPCCFTKKRIGGFLDQVERDIDSGNCSEVVVESSNIASAMWGELIAERLGCKHLTFIMQERFNFSAKEKEFVRFKLGRHELAGITGDSIKHMLPGEEIAEDPSMRVKAFCNNTIDECEDVFSDRLDPEAVMTVGSIGRLEKPYVLPLLNELRRIFSDGRRYNLVMIGGTRANKQYQAIEDVFADMPNVNLIITGYLFPIPKTLVNNCDVFVSSAGSAIATYYQKRPTVNLNPNDGSIIGVLGLTYQQGEYTIYSSNYELSELERFMRMAMDEKDDILYKDIMADGDYERRMAEEFSRHLGFLKLSPAGIYFDTRSVKYRNRKYRPFNVLGKILGPDVLYRSIDGARKKLK